MIVIQRVAGIPASDGIVSNLAANPSHLHDLLLWMYWLR